MTRPPPHDDSASARLRRDSTSARLRRDAELLAVRVLGWLAEDPDRIAAFAAASGTDPRNLRVQAREPGFSGFVLDFLLADEALLIDCCAALQVPPDHPMRARAALPGGDPPNWT